MAMKKIIVVLLFIIPCLCFGQGMALPDIKIDYRMKSLSVVSSSNYPAILDPLNISFERGFRIIIDMPTIKNSIPPLFIVDGIVMESDSLSTLSLDDIKSIEVFKENPPLICSNRFNGIILITTKGNEPIDLDDLCEITVLDPGYETFLLMQKPKEFYSASSLKVQNAMIVSEWNYRYSQPLHYNPDIYEVKIDYEANRYYGLEFEYRLYMFFKFMEKEHRIAILNDSQTIVL